MSEEILLQKAFPIIEEIPEKIFFQLEERQYKDFIPAEKNLSYITTCEKVKRDVLVEFQHEMLDGLVQFGYPYKELKHNNSENSKIDRWIGKFLYEKMQITPSVAATLGMWQFMNLYMFPSVVYWRWGNAKHRYISSVRNYCGTMWWRQYFFTQSSELEKVYIFLTEDEIVSLYERTRTRGLPEHIRNNVLWYREFCKKYEVKDKEFYRLVIKNYNAELGFRSYYALTNEDLHKIYEQAFVMSLGMNLKDIQNSKVNDPVDVERTLIEHEPPETKKKKIIVKRLNTITKSSQSTQSFSSEFLKIEEEINTKNSIEEKNQKEETVKMKTKSDLSTFLYADSNVLILRNSLLNRVEITFETIPKEIIKTEIKRIGFKYDYIEKKWYAPETPILIGEIKKIFG